MPSWHEQGELYFYVIRQGSEGFNDRVLQSTKMVSSPGALYVYAEL